MMIQTLSSLLLSALFAAAAPTNGAIEARQSSCAPVYVIFCRGTLETAPLGTIVGPIFASTLENLIPDVSVVGVTYPADIEGYLEGGDPIGISDMETLAESYASSCPDGTIVLSGYSQGAQITHDALNDLESSNTAVFDLIKAVVTWGDPYHNESTYGVPFQYYCNTGDLICDDTDIVTAAHLEYGENGDAAAGAEWVASTLGYS